MHVDKANIVLSLTKLTGLNPIPSYNSMVFHDKLQK